MTPSVLQQLPTAPAASASPGAPVRPSSMEAAVDRGILEQMMDWGHGIVDFQRHHALDGLYIGSGMAEASGRWEAHDAFLLGLVNCFWFWYDDRTDRYLQHAQTPVDWEEMLAFAEQRQRVSAAGDSPELGFLRRLSELLRQRARHPREHALWLEGTARVLRAMRFEERAAQSLRTPTYTQSLEAGMCSVGLPSIMAGGYLVLEMDRPGRLEDLVLADLERHFWSAHRLKNDIISAPKERREGKAGRVSNTVLCLEQQMAPEQAVAFVQAQKEGHDRLMEQCSARLGEQDPFVRLTWLTSARIDTYYQLRPYRYEPNEGDPA